MKEGRTNENSLQVLSKQYEQTKVDEASALVTYVGFTDFGVSTSSPRWIIMKIEQSSSSYPKTTTISYATNYKDNTNVWDDRATLNYFS